MNNGKCVLCSREGALAAFGIALGLMFIYMSVDVIRGLRKDNSDTELLEVSNDGTVDE